MIRFVPDPAIFQMAGRNLSPPVVIASPFTPSEVQCVPTRAGIRLRLRYRSVGGWSDVVTASGHKVRLLHGRVVRLDLTGVDLTSSLFANAEGLRRLADRWNELAGRVHFHAVADMLLAHAADIFQPAQ